MEPNLKIQNATRRELLSWGGYGFGAMALGSLFASDAKSSPSSIVESPHPGSPHLESSTGSAAFDESMASPGLPGFPHFAPKAKRVVFLTQSGAPSQIELFDPKPELKKRTGIELPDSVRMGQAVSTMTRGQKQRVLPAWTRFKKHGQCGMEFGHLIPHMASIADEICMIRSMHTEFINHAPAMTFLLTGHQLPGRPTIGSWVNYGLGSLNRDLPEYVVMVSKTGNTGDQPLYDYYWGSGFLPSKLQGVQFRGGSDPVLYLKNPRGIDQQSRRLMLDGLNELNQRKLQQVGDPEIATRIAQYEMAFRMQTSVPDLVDLKTETDATFTLYGPDSRTPGTYANNCLLARRLLEKGVRFVQVFLGDWDHHSDMYRRLGERCRIGDQASAALVKDLKQRGMLEDTLVVWSGEFGRGIAAQTKAEDITADPKAGRDHHPRCFSMWMAGGGLKRGHVHGKTDDFCFNVAEDPVHVHDLQATIMHLLGIDHKKHTYRFMGRDFRLTDVHGHVVHDIIA